MKQQEPLMGFEPTTDRLRVRHATLFIYCCVYL